VLCCSDEKKRNDFFLREKEKKGLNAFFTLMFQKVAILAHFKKKRIF